MLSNCIRAGYDARTLRGLLKSVITLKADRTNPFIPLEAVMSQTTDNRLSSYDHTFSYKHSTGWKYALTVNPYIYVSCIKQFWNTVVVKQTNDVTRLQALVDKKKVMITKATIRDAIRLDDAEGVDCLPNEEIFAELARMGVETPLIEGMLVAREPEEQGAAEEEVQGNDNDATQEADTGVTGDDRVDTSNDTIMEDVSNQGRMIDELDKDEGAALISEKEEEKKARGSSGGGYQCKIITEVVTTASTLVSATSTIILATEPKVPTAAPVKVVAASTRRRKGVVIRDPEEESTTKIPDETKFKDKGNGIMVEEPKPMKKKQQDVAIDHVKQKAKEDPYVQRYQVMKKRPQIEAQARRNMIMYLKNTAGFGLDYFKGMSYNDIRPIFKAKFNTNIKFLLKLKEEIEEEENRALESINETLASKAAKRRRLNEEAEDVEDLKQHLEIVPDEDDDVYTEVTPLARKNFDREDLESLWSIVKERFSTSKPNNYFDDYLLTTLRATFGRPDEQDQVWKSQRSVHG
nr:hypothetical protein [Tanacetum cinerariifolium]